MLEILTVVGDDFFADELFRSYNVSVGCLRCYNIVVIVDFRSSTELCGIVVDVAFAGIRD